MVYLESAYNWADPDFRAAVQAAPPVSGFAQPPRAMASLAAFLAYQHDTWYPDLPNMHAVEGLLRSQVVIRRDGSLEDRVPAERANAHLSTLWTEKPPNYREVKCLVLAIYGQTFYDPHIKDRVAREGIETWEKAYWAPFQAKSLAQAQRELSRVRVVRIPGAHVNFLIMQRERIVREIRQFLDAKGR